VGDSRGEKCEGVASRSAQAAGRAAWCKYQSMHGVTPTVFECWSQLDADLLLCLSAVHAVA
jgi:hypothetical protein